MKKKSTAKNFENRPITRGNIDAGRLIPRKRGTNGAVLPVKQRVNICLDSAIVEHFKAQSEILSPEHLAAIRRAAPKAKGKTSPA